MIAVPRVDRQLLSDGKEPRPVVVALTASLMDPWTMQKAWLAHGLLTDVQKG